MVYYNFLSISHRLKVIDDFSFGWDSHFKGGFWAVLGALDPQNMNLCEFFLQKAFPYWTTHTYTKNAQCRYISPPRGGATFQPISTKLGGFVHLECVVNAAKYCVDRSKGFRMARVQSCLICIHRPSRS